MSEGAKGTLKAAFGAALAEKAGAYQNRIAGWRSSSLDSAHQLSKLTICYRATTLVHDELLFESARSFGLTAPLGF